MQKATGKTLFEFGKENVFDKVGMKSINIKIIFRELLEIVTLILIILSNFYKKSKILDDHKC